MAIVIAQSDPGFAGSDVTTSPRTLGITAQSGLSAIVVVTHLQTSSGNLVSGVTVNGVAAAEATGADTGTSGVGRVQFWIVYAPASGAYDVVVTHTGARLGISVHQITGSLTSAAIRTATKTNANSSAPSLSVASAVDDLVIDGLLSQNTATATVGGSQTQLTNFGVGSIPSARVASSREAGAATVSMDWTLSVASEWKLGAISIIPAATGYTPPTYDFLKVLFSGA